LGLFSDEPKLLRAAATYLETYNTRGGMPLEQRQKIAAHWTHERKQRQAEIARRVNDVENKKLNDYVCPTCSREFEQITKGRYGAHRKACLHWKQVAEALEEEMGKTLDEILDTV